MIDMKKPYIFNVDNSSLSDFFYKCEKECEL